jgi:hypothetical protein
MFYMLTCFDLKPGVTTKEFSLSIDAYKQHMKENNLVDSMGSIGQRQRDSSLDTDNERDHQFYFMTTFQDRAQSDKARDYILRHEEPVESIHKTMYLKVQNPIFICWQDL